MDDVKETTDGGATAAAEDFPTTARTTLKRLPKRGSFERETVNAILDEGFVCHVGFVVDGQPFVIPTAYGRKGDVLYIHGARASRMQKALAAGADVCVTVTLVDGLVLARSAFHHSINYRSVVVFGRARVVEDEEEKNAALEAFTEHVMLGRWADVRWPTAQELAATTVLAIQLSEASAKVRTGPPIDDEEDYALPVWAGVLPLGVEPGEPLADPRLPDGTPLPGYLEDFDLSRRKPD
ncbi:MAG TPA: pyridoxamine 5'-phosphate oxidase family protein [Pyrinomonadaceae bacterium]